MLETDEPGPSLMWNEGICSHNRGEDRESFTDKNELYVIAFRRGWDYAEKVNKEIQ